MHSEFNHAEGQATHFFQIWIEPNVLGIEPGYEQKTVPQTSKRGVLKVVASPQGEGDAVKISADATLSFHAEVNQRLEDASANFLNCQEAMPM